MTKTIKSRDEDGEAKEVKNRIEILYEHHKYLQKKQEAEKFARSNEVVFDPIAVFSFCRRN